MKQLAFDIGAAIREEMRARQSKPVLCVECGKPIPRSWVPTKKGWLPEYRVNPIDGKCASCAWMEGA